MTRSSSPSDPLAGIVLEGRYRLDEQIGSGGMCVVYRGFDQRLERLVAVKVAAEHLLGRSGRPGDQRIEERFRREALAIARLSDPGLVGVYDQGSVRGRPYVVLEHVAGGSARELLDERGAMPPYAAAALLEPVLRALGAAHSAGFVHGDVKPENILISTTGEVKVADFGSVMPVSPSAGGGWTQYVGQGHELVEVFGTAGYLAPEQVESAPWAQVSPAIDVYAAGLVLYELLVGELPFAAEGPAALARARLVQDVPPPSRAVDGVPMQFDHLVLRATERDLRARYPDARSMAADLEEAGAGLALPRYTLPAPSGRPPRPQAPPSGQPAAPSRAQHTTINLAAVVPEEAPADVLPAPDSPETSGAGLPRSISWQRVLVWLVVVLILGVAAATCGYSFGAIVEQQLG